VLFRAPEIRTAASWRGNTAVIILGPARPIRITRVIMSLIRVRTIPGMSPARPWPAPGLSRRPARRM
jgi:hypothetical protein